MDVGEDLEASGFSHTAEDSEAFFQSRAAEALQAGTVRLIERSFEDEFPDDFADGLCHEVHVLFTLDYARARDQAQCAAHLKHARRPDRSRVQAASNACGGTHMPHRQTTGRVDAVPAASI